MDYKLKYDLNALCYLEEETGMFLGDYVKELFSPESKKPRFLAARLIFRAGLLHSNPDISLKEAGVIVSEELKKKGGFERLINSVFGAIKEAMPEEVQAVLPDELGSLEEALKNRGKGQEENPRESTAD